MLTGSYGSLVKLKENCQPELVEGGLPAPNAFRRCWCSCGGKAESAITNNQQGASVKNSYLGILINQWNITNIITECPQFFIAAKGKK